MECITERVSLNHSQNVLHTIKRDNCARHTAGLTEK